MGAAAVALGHLFDANKNRTLPQTSLRRSPALAQAQPASADEKEDFEGWGGVAGAIGVYLSGS